MSQPTPVLQVRNISKHFGGVQALDEVSLEFAAGEIHAIVGENGAGKSTLMKILAGVHQPDSGRILLRGMPLKLENPKDALQKGIGMVHQETVLCPNLSIAENLFLGNERAGRGGWIDFVGTRQAAGEALKNVGLDVDADTAVARLSVAQRHLVQIARALLENASILIFDEPTASLSLAESETLFRLIGQLKQQQVTILYISHRIEEVFRIASRVTVLRDGGVVETLETRSTSQGEVVSRMVGRELSDWRVPPAKRGLEPLLETRALFGPGYEGVNLQVFPGEIVTLAGLVGSGRTELLRALFGLDRFASGTVRFDGKDLPSGGLRLRVARGMGLIPEDRREQGLVLCLSLRDNLALPRMSMAGSPFFLDRAAEEKEALAAMKELAIRSPDPEFPAGNLSGGNQQKVVVAKWLALKPKLLLVDEPTQGVDVAAKQDIHRLLGELASQGLGVLAASSDLPEALAISHRIYVMRRGRIQGELQATEATEQRVMGLAAGFDPREG